MPEWLPKSLSGQGQHSSGVLESVRVNFHGARENASQAAQMAGISRGTQDDNPCAECCPKLTFSQRVKGCLTCFCVGICISILGTMSWWAGNMGAFGVLYTETSPRCVVQCTCRPLGRILTTLPLRLTLAQPVAHAWRPHLPRPAPLTRPNIALAATCAGF